MVSGSDGSSIRSLPASEHSDDSGALKVPSGPMLRSDSSVDEPALSGRETVINPAGKPLTIPSTVMVPSSELHQRLFPPLHDSNSGSVADPSGITLEHFRIEQRIGSGGMGAVFRAVDLRLQRQVALKILAPGQAFDEAAVKRFRNEARAAARLDHENIARVYYIGEDNGLHFIAFEFITGSTIRDLIRRSQKLTPGDTVNYALQVAYALKHTSAMGVVHRDIKPSNIIITPNGRAKLVDLGLARKDNAESQADLTVPGTTLGTFDYISPEQAKDPRSVDVRSDIYSLGCTMYHMLTGRPPYPEGTVLQKLLDHQAKDAPDPAAVNPRVPENLSNVVRRMMNSDRSRRHQTADQLLRELTHIAGALNLRGVNPEGLVWSASGSTSGRGWRGQTGLIVTVAAFLLVVVLLQTNPGLFGRHFAQAPDNSFEVAPTGPESLTGQGVAAVPGTTPGAGTVSDPGTPSETPAAESDTGTEKPRTGETETPTGPDPSPADPDVESPDSPVTPAVPVTEIKPEDQPSDTEPGESEPAETATTDGGTGTESPATPGVPGPEPLLDESQFPVALFSADAALVKPFRSLWAACAAAEDGSTIELAFSGPRYEKPLRITKQNITIRAARGHQPVIEFNPDDPDSTDTFASMIKVQSGPLRMVNVQLVMSVPDDAPAQRYSMFGISRARQLELDRVAVTIVNPRRLPAAAVDVVYEMNDMPADGMPRPVRNEEVSIRMTDCLIRGQATLASLAWHGPLNLSLENCAAALAGDLIQFEPASAPMADTARASVLLRHVTARLEGSAVQFSGPVSADGPVLDCEVRNSLIACTGDNAVIYSDVTVNGEDARRQLLWNGERNFYDNQIAFWQIEDLQEFMNFDQWRANWGPAREVGPNNSGIQWQVVLSDVESPEATFDSLDKTVFALMPPTVEAPNSAVDGATDGSDVGCDLNSLPELFAEEPAEPPTEQPVEDAD